MQDLSKLEWKHLRLLCPMLFRITLLCVCEHAYVCCQRQLLPIDLLPNQEFGHQRGFYQFEFEWQWKLVWKWNIRCQDWLGRKPTAGRVKNLFIMILNNFLLLSLYFFLFLFLASIIVTAPKFQKFK